MNKLPRVDVIIDLETLDTALSAQVIQISAVSFNIYTGETIEKFNHRIKFQKDRTFSESTLKFWVKTNPELLGELLEGQVDVKTSLEHFSNWIFEMRQQYEEVNLWGNGILFDNGKLLSLYESEDIPYPVHYKNDRDVRTLIDIYCNRNGTTENELKNLFEFVGTPHNALDDCLHYIKIVGHCFQNLMVEELFYG